MVKNGYQDLDKIENNTSTLTMTTTGANPPFRRLISMSDPNIYKKSAYMQQHQSGLSLNTRISLGSICLLRPSNSFYNQDNGTNLMIGSPVQFLKSYHRERALLVTFILFYICFLMVGAICFQIIETPVELEERNEISIMRTNFLLKYPQVNGKENSQMHTKKCFKKLIIPPAVLYILRLDVFNFI